MFGMPKIPYGLLGVAGGTDTRPTNTPEDTSALQKLYASVVAQNRTPAGRVARGWNQFAPQSGAAPPMLPTPAMPAEVDMSQPKPPVQASDAPTPGALSPGGWAGPHSVGGAPLPNVGPTSVGGAPISMGPTSVGGAPLAGDLGPSPASDASGPDVIQKLMSYFKNKDNPSD